MLELDLPKLSHKGRTLLHEIAFRVEEGQALTLMGPNGAGKSSLARVLCGLVPSHKAVRIDGSYLEEMPAEMRRTLINYIPPKLELYDDFMRVRDYLALCGEGDGAAALERFGISSLVDAYLAKLSSGEQQMVMLACADLHAAKYTIYDEPTANLDPLRTQQVFGYLKGQDRQKIVITHDMQLAFKLGFPIYYLHEGRGYYYRNSESFFSESNLRRLFGESLLRRGDIVVVNL
ncbi:MAG TPA: ABC transporter ATP-binding protein [Campylobacteraceae bacterium]|nr:ABC transporter ATP-binding protein [Campylobacteraceae bacterium]HHD83602.1 ABC transporter ATP-binding protein [Campylobacteraceae bacterium]